MTVKAVLFDLDGTLVDSVPSLTVGVNEVLAHWQAAPLTEKVVADLVGKGVRRLMEDVFSLRGLPQDDATIDSACQFYVEKNVARGSRLVKFYPGAMQAVAQLRASGVKAVLVTNKSRAMTESFLEDCHLTGAFDAVVAGDDTSHPKPAGDMLLLGAQKVGVEPACCVMVGDSRNDALAGRNAGIPVRLVATGYNEGEPVEQWGPAHGFDAVYDNVPEALHDFISGK